MIPNLVAAVKSYMGHENEILTRITELRSHSFQPSQEAEQIKSGNELSGLLTKLQLSVENYPELKANEQFHRLQNSIEDMELQLQAIRRTYNAAVTDYNNTIEMFPSSVVARQQGHHQEELIDISRTGTTECKCRRTSQIIRIWTQLILRNYQKQLRSGAFYG